MNDLDVQKQIRQMVAFIDQEANEKAAEIDAKAQEEFAIEKDNLVNQQKQKILQFYQRKEKQIELQRKIQHSNLQNQSRIAILKAREDLIQQLRDQAIDQLSLIANDETRYTQLLTNLVAQALFRLVEREVIVKCREKDINIVNHSVEAAIGIYKNVIKKDVKVTVLNNSFLGPDIAGGIEAYNSDRKIKINNTLEARLDMLFNQMIPEIREKLFGRNKSRVHDN
ncbi:V-type proton ATPase subunit E 1 [Brachionus plicatilis]|uniref:V-type proton ATPase subunit E 1 n=1 Tax=Brachionus plicatilis TaxID=10195 RepID=A0A3M7SQ29_BRAPC|nr:V-type proton ATPase subunit E 1 [Brachionus plicatilis]